MKLRNRKLTKECDYMGKAILAVIVTLIVGYLGTVVGLELLGNWDEFGLLITIAVIDRKSTRLNSSHASKSRMPSSA